jgi:hypothetical protein
MESLRGLLLFTLAHKEQSLGRTAKSGTKQLLKFTY